MFHSEKKAVHEMKNSTEEKLKNLQSEYDRYSNLTWNLCIIMCVSC